METKYLKSRTLEIDIPEDNPFKYDKLGREKTATTLTDIVSFYGQSGCVMALNGEWGAGKTTFVKMWRQSLINDGFKTLYFNAWSSDYTDDPLLAMVSELKELSPTSANINSIVGKTGRIMGSVLISAYKGLIKKATGIDCDAVSAALDATEEIGKEYLKTFEEQKTTVEEFKDEVREYVADNAVEKPVVFFVDELDRCNPHYAVAVLERIKHLFDIPNIIFVLAINKKELCNAIQGFYGSTNINSEEYLRRFIDIEYSLTKPGMDAYCEYLFDEYGFGEFFENEERKRKETVSFMKMAISLGESEETNLRQLERVFAYARLALMQFQSNSYIIPDVYFLLCFWKVMNPDFYNTIRKKGLTNQELLHRIEEILPKSLLITDGDRIKNRSMYATIANLVYCYDTTTTEGPWGRRCTIKGKINETSKEYEYALITSVLNKKLFDEALDYFCNDHRVGKYDEGLSFIFNKIDLLESFKV